MAFLPRSANRERDMGLTSSGGVIQAWCVVDESGGRTAASMITIGLVDVKKNEMLVQLHQQLY